MFDRCDRTTACNVQMDRQTNGVTDRQTLGHSRFFAKVSSRGKNGHFVVMEAVKWTIYCQAKQHYLIEHASLHFLFPGSSRSHALLCCAWTVELCAYVDICIRRSCATHVMIARTFFFQPVTQYKPTVASWNMLPVSVGVTLVHAAPTSIRKSMSRQTRDIHTSLSLVQRRHGVVDQRRRTTASSCTGEWDIQYTEGTFMSHLSFIC